MSTSPRDILVERLQLDAIGPTKPDEIIPERPSERYLTAILYPNGDEIPPEEDDSVATAGDDDEEADDAPAAIWGAKRPSSCGISFALAHDEHPVVRVTVSCARYDYFYVQPGTESPSTDQLHMKRENQRWRRVPLKATVDVDLAAAIANPKRDLEHEGLKGLELFVRFAPGKPASIVTIALVNMLPPGEDRTDTEAASFLQVDMRVDPVDPAKLTTRPNRSAVEDPDARIATLIYRDVKEIAVGHTCSARWGPNDAAPTWVATDWLPTAVVRRMRPEGDPVFDVLRKNPKNLRPLEAAWTSDHASDGELVEGLRLLVRTYETWLDGQDARVPSLPADLRKTAQGNIAACRVAAARMSRSVGLLENDAITRNAWRLAAGAMALQFRWTKKTDLRWHPFQLAFQLLVLESLADRDAADRAIMDLLWFPTGGGKTEAYLSLTAFLLFYRRLKYGTESGSGTSVIMRYTLRLLTVQQFQRASALVLACEAIRRGNEQIPSVPTPALGDTSFSIGLWVGGAATPNTFEDARTALTKGGASTPRQLEHCPRCRERLDYAADIHAKAILIRCTGPNCYFADRKLRPMPIWVVDTDIYRERPSLVIATLDKFAQIVRKPQTAALFGTGTPHDPPELVIQDELHLISGPLGSIAGLYEVAIDALCTRTVGARRRRPKVIGSTATIRRAKDQVLQLFDRDAFQFPPPVIDARNSGFGIEDVDDPGRRYVGLTTAGRSAKYALQYTYASLLQAAADARIPRGVKGQSPRDRNWTLTGYFNSLRELGGAVTLVLDDVLRQLKTFGRRYGETPRPIAPPIELTSRVPSSDIPATLDQLDLGEGEPGCVDVLLASNMISVGVDISRLGLMVVAAQPKTIAEYIQATSRVGRKDPGLVVVVYNHPRVRDRSHFETFPTWHRALYRSVEATSVTPFASRARDKALHAVLVAMARHLVGALANVPNLDAATLPQVQSLVAEIERRAANVDKAEAGGVRRGLDQLVQLWLTNAPHLSEYWKDKDPGRSLLIGAEQYATLVENGDWTDAWPTPNSMREVEPSSLFRLKHATRAPLRSRRRAVSADE
jgi:hypothetical protein